MATSIVPCPKAAKWLSSARLRNTFEHILRSHSFLVLFFISEGFCFRGKLGHLRRLGAKADAARNSCGATRGVGSAARSGAAPAGRTRASCCGDTGLPRPGSAFPISKGIPALLRSATATFTHRPVKLAGSLPRSLRLTSQKVPGVNKYTTKRPASAGIYIRTVKTIKASSTRAGKRTLPAHQAPSPRSPHYHDTPGHPWPIPGSLPSRAGPGAPSLAPLWRQLAYLLATSSREGEGGDGLRSLGLPPLPLLARCLLPSCPPASTPHPTPALLPGEPRPRRSAPFPPLPSLRRRPHLGWRGGVLPQEPGWGLGEGCLPHSTAPEHDPGVLLYPPGAQGEMAAGLPLASPLPSSGAPRGAQRPHASLGWMKLGSFK